MELFTWNDSYSLNIETIDNDHKGLLDIINKLFDAMRHGKAKEIHNEILDQLINYTKTHFQREELFFKSTNYPDYEEHKLQHEHFITKVIDLKRQLNQVDQKISIELMKFLSEWLINHILVSDRKYMPHFKKFGIK